MIRPLLVAVFLKNCSIQEVQSSSTEKEKNYIENENYLSLEITINKIVRLLLELFHLRFP